jgi:aldehyde dehydrogenase (NAD+)
VRLSGQTFPSERPGFTCYTVLQPVGVVAAITPWNFPVVSPVRKIAPALACGNSVVLKPASLTPWSAVFITNLLEKAGLPPGVLNLVIGSGIGGTPDLGCPSAWDQLHRVDRRGHSHRRKLPAWPKSN